MRGRRAGGESGPLRAVHLSHHKWTLEDGLGEGICCPLRGRWSGFGSWMTSGARDLHQRQGRREAQTVVAGEGEACSLPGVGGA